MIQKIALAVAMAAIAVLPGGMIVMIIVGIICRRRSLLPNRSTNHRSNLQPAA